MRRVTIGLDECGWGPYAGSMFIGLAACETSVQKDMCCRDSKSYSKNMLRMYQSVTADAPKVLFRHVHEVSAWRFDEVGHTIARAGAFRHCLLLAMQLLTSRKIPFDDVEIVIDGACLFGMKSEKLLLRAVPKADRDFRIVSFASCIAKIEQVREMATAHATYPDYRFNEHHGYGTAVHEKVIEEFGAIVGFHRMKLLEKLWRTKYRKPLPIRGIP